MMHRNSLRAPEWGFGLTYFWNDYSCQYYLELTIGRFHWYFD